MLISIKISRNSAFFRFRFFHSLFSGSKRGSRVVRWCWVNFQCRGVLLIWIRVGQGPTALAVDVDGCSRFGYFFSLPSFLFSFSLSLWEMARYRLKYCLKGLLSPKQPTNQHQEVTVVFLFLQEEELFFVSSINRPTNQMSLYIFGSQLRKG